jgi:plastocyanin
VKIEVKRRHWYLVFGVAALAVLTMTWPARPATPSMVSVVNLHYTPKTVTLERGAELYLTNVDLAARLESLGHTLTEYRPGDSPRFDTALVGFGAAGPAHGTAELAAGTYTFFCQVHPFMRGTLVVR